MEENYVRNKVKIANLFTILIPFILSIIFVINNILVFNGVKCNLFNYIGGTSLLVIIYFYIISWVFKFCIYQKMFIHYLLIVNIINTYDYYFVIPISDYMLFLTNLSTFGICVILYGYFKYKKL